MMIWRRRRAVSLVNGRIAAGDAIVASMRFTSRVESLDEPPAAGDLVLDLEGAFVLPGLINAHDHLELNHYGDVVAPATYANASDWIDAMRPRLQHDPVLRAGRRHPLPARLFIGGLKNLLSGTTTVAHHNPRYAGIDRHAPVRVVRRYGWAHSFALEREPVGARGEPGGSVQNRFRKTPRDAPFIVHAGEGVDSVAAEEIASLDRLGCLAPNTVVVHAVACPLEDWQRMLDRGAGLVWCPTSNMRLFGRTIAARPWLDAAPHARQHLALATDSRLTGARDLLDELRAAASASAVTPRELLTMVTSTPARLLGLDEVGRLMPGARADFIVLSGTRHDAAQALLRSARADLALVVLDGRPMIGAPRWRPFFKAFGREPRTVCVDGFERLADARLASRIARSPIREPGVECRS